MLNRICYVLSTYVTRPAFWVLGGLYVVGVIVVANCGDSQSARAPSLRGRPVRLARCF